MTDEQRRANDTHRPAVVLAVLGVLALHAYLLTPVSYFLGLPRPQQILGSIGLQPRHVFDRDGLVNSVLDFSISRPSPTSGADLLFFYAIVAGAFLCAYFLPLRYKQPSLLAWSVAAILALFGLRATAGLLFAHVVVYLTLHPRRRGLPFLALLPGVLGYLAFAHGHPRTLTDVGWLALVAAAALLVYRYIYVSLLALPRLAGILRALVVQGALISVCVAALIEGRTGHEWRVPLGILMFFWHWARVMLYHVDYKDGLVPEDIPLWQYLVVFIAPGTIPVWNWGVEIGQGYSYTANSFLCEEKNKTVISGARILLVALIYLSFYFWGQVLLVRAFESIGINPFDGYIDNMVKAFASGQENIGALSVLATTMVELVFWTMTWGGAVHLKVGLWRICGFRTDPYFDRPWLSTNLVVCWTRFTFHYREFLVRAFYYPAFFRFFKKQRVLRIVFATFAAAALGNMVWGHLTEEMFYEGAHFRNFFGVFRTWPYYVLLAAGISLTELYLLKRRHRRRKPWTLGPRIALDVLAAYCTVQFYAMIHIFIFPAENSTVWGQLRLFLRGFGIHL